MTLVSLSYLFFTLFYPINLHIFTFLFVRTARHQFQLNKNGQFTVRLLSTIFSCFMLSIYLKFLPSLLMSVSLFKYGFLALLPFILPLCLNITEQEEGEGEDFQESERLGVSMRVLRLRNYFIAPLIEELYFRLLLPNLNASILLLSISFSLAHAHPLLFPKNWNRNVVQDLSSQCLISFLFGLVSNCIRSKIGLENNVWLLLVLALLHGVANRTGVPVIIGRNTVVSCLQLTILIISLILIVFI